MDTEANASWLAFPLRESQARLFFLPELICMSKRGERGPRAQRIDTRGLKEIQGRFYLPRRDSWRVTRPGTRSSVSVEPECQVRRARKRVTEKRTAAPRDSSNCDRSCDIFACLNTIVACRVTATVYLPWACKSNLTWSLEAKYFASRSLENWTRRILPTCANVRIILCEALFRVWFGVK